MFRRYNRAHSRFDQPDPYDGSYDLTNPQSFNRYSYTQNDPVTFVDPRGLDGELGGWIGITLNPPSGSVTITGSFDDFFRHGGSSGDGTEWRTLAVIDQRMLNRGIPQNIAPRNPNCIRNAVAGSIGTSRGIIEAVGPNGPTGLAVHDGDHVLSGPGGSAAVTTLGPLAGTVIRTGNQGDGLHYVDVRLNSSIDGVAYNVRYKDLLGVGVGVGTRLSAGSNIGTVRPAGDPRSEIGLHVTLVLRSEYSGYVDRVRNGQYSPMGIFMSAVNDPRSPVRCP